MLSASKSGSGLSTGYNLTRSLRFRASASAYLTRTPATATNRKTWTWSAWVKRGLLSNSELNYLFMAGGSGNETVITFTSNADALVGNADTLSFYQYTSGFVWQKTTSQVFRDTSAWYHIVVVFDTDNATAEDRARIYVNGARVTNWQISTNPSAGFSTGLVNSTSSHDIARANFATRRFDGYLAEVNFIDGQALTPSSFGSTNALTGVWQPARYTGTYGTNGFYLPFTDNSALTTSSNVGLGKDFSGNGNYWTTNNISITAGVTYDSMTDVPTLTSATAANFAVINPLDKYTTAAPTNGNLTVPANNTAVATILTNGVGNFYWEINNPSGVTYSAGIAGFVGGQSVVGNISAVSLTATTVGIRITAASPGSWDYTTNGTTFTVGSASVGTGLISAFFSAGTGVLNINFGQQPFIYTPPTGYVALNTYNLPTSTIVKGNTVMDATLWTGDGTTPKSQTNAAGFKPDFVWIKSRSNAYSHNLFDSVRGAGAARSLQSDNTKSESDVAVDTALYGYLSAFNSNGFSTTNGSSTPVWVNASGGTYVAWQWQAGQGSTSSNTNGSITSTVSVNASAGFSVVTYTGTAVAGTIGHGLGVAPQLIIVKPRSATITTDAWNVYHVSTGNTNFLVLNATDASAAASNRWNNTSPTSSVFSIGTVPSSVAVGYVAYCWTPIAGYSSMGSYTGNGSSDGVFVYLGFRPKFVLAKRTDTSGTNWLLQDSVRGPYNLTENTLYPNLSDAEATGAGYFDLLSNGFKLRTSGSGLNASGGTYIYICFAENPFRNALAR